MKPSAKLLLVGAAFASLNGCAAAGRTAGRSPVPAPLSAEADEPATLVTQTGSIHGTIRLPAGSYPVPVALIISGSGPTDRDGNSPALPGQNNSLKMIAEGLSSRGIASLRYDKRGIAASAGALSSEEDIRFDHFVGDAVEWIRKLRADPRFSTTTVIGHSEGSLIGMLAARTAGADAYVSIAGAGRTPQVIITEQLARQLPDTLVRQAAELMRRIEAGDRPDSVPVFLRALFRPSVQPYLRSWFRYDPTTEIAKLTVPVLVIQGTTDLQITEADARRLSESNRGSRLVLVPGMNHVLKQASGTLGEQLPSYSNPALPVVPVVIDEIAATVKSLGSRPRDTALGVDKLQHFLMTGYVEALSFAGLRAAGADRGTSYAGAIAAAAAASVGKEIYDRKSYGLFSFGDLVWDTVGAAAAFLLISKSQ